jgi:Cytochrome c
MVRTHLFSLAAAASLALMAGPAAAATATDAAHIASHGSSGGAPPCASCHGARGLGNASAGFPRLAGLPDAYLMRQLESFVAGKRHSGVMDAVSHDLDTAQMKAMASYYAAMPPPAKASGKPLQGAELQEAHRLARDGDWQKALPGCDQCHGPGGIGVAPDFPPLVGQSAQYLQMELAAWRSGARKDDPLHLMGAMAGKLTPQQIPLISAYYASLPPAGPAGGSNHETPAHDHSPADAAGAGRLLTRRRHATSAAAAAASTAAQVSGNASADAPPPAASVVGFRPPALASLPNDDFGKMVRLGRNIFQQTGRYAGQYVGNALSCQNCHLDAGRLTNSAPLWAAWVAYPAYRSKNHRVNSYADRLQGCFRFSMNGKAPPLGSRTLLALSAYSYWLAQGAPTGDAKMAGRGYPKIDQPAKPPDFARGAKVYAAHCALCHGSDGEGRRSGGRVVFPPLWGAQSFNWGAGMAKYDTAAGFIKANMPLGLPSSLSDQQSWDVAYFMDAQPRPQDPRYTGSLATTRKQFHDTPYSLYGQKIHGRTLGSAGG